MGVVVVAQDTAPLSHGGHEEEVFGEVEAEEGLYQRLGQDRVAFAQLALDWGFEEVEFVQGHDLHRAGRMDLPDVVEG